ncbi:MAG: MarR family transcriptional regulator [Proteobacteria bacterium]|nr:MarR family transcriptional regulator [Pseudomonadota bacterium]
MTVPSAALAEERTLSYLLSDVVRLMRRDFHERAEGLRLTPALTRLLFYVHKDPGSHQATLAQHLDVTPVTLCRMVDRLVARGYVRRQRDPHDRRAVRLYVAARGEPLVERMMRIADETRGRALKGVSAAEQRTLVALLGRLAANLAGSA